MQISFMEEDQKTMPCSGFLPGRVINNKSVPAKTHKKGIISYHPLLMHQLSVINWVKIFVWKSDSPLCQIYFCSKIRIFLFKLTLFFSLKQMFWKKNLNKHNAI